LRTSLTPFPPSLFSRLFSLVSFLFSLFSFLALSQGRTVKNVWSAYGDANLANNDVNGHGSHCAGSVGGRTFGVASCANLNGVKVLSDSGSGSFSNIINGLNFVLGTHLSLAADAKTVVSMSLGGSCGTSCATDPLILKVAELTAAGIAVVVAAGNDGQDAKTHTPAAAESALTIGASNIK
jgi:cerevisin